MVFMAGLENVHVGTSGWHYGDCAGPFYPRDLPKKDFLAYYAEHFHTVEVNNSFYQLPKKETLKSWRKIVPADFIYVRLHGPEAAYRGKYSVSALSGWAGAFSAWTNQGREVFCYFDNDEAGFASQNAMRLQGMMGG